MLRHFFRLGAAISAGRAATRGAEPDEAPGPKSRMMLTTRRYPVYYLPITKCGCTYLKNLLYFLDHDRPHPAPDRIHEDEGALMRAGDVPPAFIRESRFAFTVLRDPLDRFLSLYFDKIWGEGPGSFPSLRAMLARELGLDLARDLDAEGHRVNCRRLIGWIGANLARETPEPVNPHWRRQSSRLRRARAMAPVPLILDGLDWQLPRFLGPAIPDLAARMQEVTARNAAARPVPAETLATPDLAALVHEVYREDAARVARARADWARRAAGGWENLATSRPRPAPAAPTISLTTTHRYPVHFLAIPKAGCTFLRNLFYLLDHGRPHPDPLAIQADGCLVSEKVAADGHRGRAFLVLRNPIDRFFSLYFDKVIGPGPHAFPWIAANLAERRGFHSGRRLGLAQHRENCDRLIGFIASQIARDGAGAVNGHWRPQVEFAARARPFGLRALTLEGLADQLPRHLGQLVPDLPALMARLDARNPSARPAKAEAILDERLESRILAVYGPDRELWSRVTEAWAAEGRAPLV
ncbi:MAG TPA: sulfotransferase family 2 domain-containing protein [Paracoccaceae bacterium]|nr:sulfotransferase family 2 domain-containing protein [Paracoccaceae bacterium]